MITRSLARLSLSTLLLSLVTLCFSSTSWAATDFSGAWNHPVVPEAISLPDPPAPTLIRANQLKLSDVFAFTGNNTHSGTETFTGASNLFGTVNKQVWVDGIKYTTIEQALLDAQCATRCQLNLPSGFSETVTSTITLGNGTTQFVHLHGLPGASIACNLTGGGSPCFKVSNGSGITGELTGTQSGGAQLGFNFTYPSTFNGTAIISTDPAATGGNGYITLEKFFVYGNPSATISTAVVNIENLLGQAVLKNFYIANFGNTIGVRVATSTGGVGNTGTGPLVLDNIWSDGFNNAGARPCVISTNNSKSMLPIIWHSGVCAHPGSGLAMIEANGNGNTLGATQGLSTPGLYLENLANGNSIGLKVRDIVNVDFSGLVCVIRDTDTCVDISESAANLTAGIHGGPVWKSSPTNAATLINNHITGETIVSAVQPFYNYGGEAGTSTGAFTVSGNQVQFKDLANRTLFNVSLGQQAGVTIFSRADAQGQMGYGCGLATEQVCLWGVFKQDGSLLWAQGDDASGNWILSDRVNIKTRMKVAPSASAGISVEFPQVISDLGTACTNGELALSAGWQSTGSATVTGVVGTGQTCEWTITTGTTTAANPTITDTLTNALPSANTVCWMIITGGNRTAAASDSFDQTTLSATAPVFTFQGTPTAGGKTYKIVRTCGP